MTPIGVLILVVLVGFFIRQLVTLLASTARQWSCAVGGSAGSAGKRIPTTPASAAIAGPGSDNDSLFGEGSHMTDTFRKSIREQADGTPRTPRNLTAVLVLLVLAAGVAYLGYFWFVRRVVVGRRRSARAAEEGRRPQPARRPGRHPPAADREDTRRPTRRGRRIRRLQRHPRGGLPRPARTSASARSTTSGEIVDVEQTAGAERQGRHRHQEVRAAAATRGRSWPTRANQRGPLPIILQPGQLQRVRQPLRVRDQAGRPGRRSTPATAASSR